MKSRPVGRDPVRASIEIHEHRRIATRRDNPVGRRCVLELVRPEQLGSTRAFEPVFSIEHISRPAVGIAHGRRIRESFDLSCALPAVVAITGGANDRPAECLERDAAAGARCNHCWCAGHLLAITMSGSFRHPLAHPGEEVHRGKQGGADAFGRGRHFSSATFSRTASPAARASGATAAGSRIVRRAGRSRAGGRRRANRRIPRFAGCHRDHDS